MSAPSAILFDFNGTLSHDEPLLLRIYQGLFARYGKPLREDEYFGQLAGLTEQGKPHPEGYLRALDLLGLGASEVVAFEDTEAGIAAATSAGLRCIAVRGPLSDDRLGAADGLVDRIDVALLQRLLAS
ncbi:MAG: HAD-IA family hydrolase [Thermoleophilia bacterium]|nr:HAD-IA family hydrolase [Thermoleophilia bacterium]